MESIAVWASRNGWKRTVVTAIVLGLVFDAIWTGDKGCDSALQRNVISSTHTGR